MLGLRGCRLGIVYPELNDMQVRAIAGAAATLKKQGLDPRPEIMVPLISTVEELKLVREQIQSVIKAVEEAEGLELSIPIGCMIELPRAAVTADEIGAYADFFSFGTNDLTQTTFGFSRDDVESAFIPQYLNKKILKANPFETLDVGVAKLVEMGVKGGHAANETIVCGICGETGGIPTPSRCTTTSVLTTCPAPPTACPSRALRVPRPRSTPTVAPKSWASL